MTRAETIERKLQAMWRDPAAREQVLTKHDYRDILYTAETPREAHTPYAVCQDPSPEGRRRLEELRQEDRREYEDWLKA